MNLRRQRAPDSLELLLDTMCNTFGGIILLAVLVTLLTSRERHESAGAKSESRAMLQRRLSIAQTNLQKAIDLHTSLQVKTNDPLWTNQLALLGERKDLQGEIDQVKSAIFSASQRLETKAAIDPADSAKQLEEDLHSAKEHEISAQNSVEAAKENTKRLQDRLGDLQKQAIHLVNDSQRSLHLPKEYDTKKKPFPVIIRYGRIYPCFNSDLSRNLGYLTWSFTEGGGELVEPKPGTGIDPVVNPAAVTALFSSQLRNSTYLAFHVYDDSFAIFMRVRELAVKMGISYGWEPYISGKHNVIFKKNGTLTLKPQS